VVSALTWRLSEFVKFKEEIESEGEVVSPEEVGAPKTVYLLEEVETENFPSLLGIHGLLPKCWC